MLYGSDILKAEWVDVLELLKVASNKQLEIALQGLREYNHGLDSRLLTQYSIKQHSQNFQFFFYPLFFSSSFQLLALLSPHQVH